VRAPLLAACLAAAAAAALADEWTAPAAERERTNPVPDSPEAQQKGRALYQRHCQSCHGDRGAGDGPAARTSKEEVPDLRDAARQQRLTDGEMLWKITTGRREGSDVVMPSMARTISREEDRWKLVLFVRTLASPSAPGS
jgi:mono/diheme cytochrome c family protein